MHHTVNLTIYHTPIISPLLYSHSQAGLMQRALEHYTELSDIKRIMQQGGGTLNPEFLLSYFGTISR